MLVQFVTEEARDTIDTYLATWGRTLADRIDVVTYESLASRAPPVARTYVFSDLERLSPDGLAAASALARRLEEAAGARVVNRPDRVLHRFELLHTLYEAGINDFRPYRLRELPAVRRYPVFLRYEHRHWGPMTGLLHSSGELEHALCRAILLGHDVRDLIIVEFRDVRSADGLVRKYASFVVGGEIVPRDLVFSEDWVQRDIGLTDAALRAEEAAFLHENRFAAALRDVVAHAGVEFGRIDFGVVDGRVQVWEINTNPVLLQAPETYGAALLPNQRAAAALLEPALARLAGGSRRAGGGDHTQVAVFQVAAQPRPRLRLRLAHRLTSRLLSSTAARASADAVASLLVPALRFWLARGAGVRAID